MTFAVVGAGINGLVAAARLATRGEAVAVHEATSRLGGSGAAIHPFGPDLDVDLGATVVPLAVASPALRALVPGTTWRHPEAPLAHIGHGTAILHRSLEATAEGLGVDGPRWARLFGPLVDDFDGVSAALLGPLALSPLRLLSAHTGLRSYARLALGAAPAAAVRFRTPAARDLFAGLAAHSGLPPSAPGSAAFALFLGAAAHAVGWPMVAGGTARITDRLAEVIVARGGAIHLDSPIDRLSQLGRPDAVLFDTPPATLARLGGVELAPALRRRFLRLPPGAAASRVDFRLSGPVPWRDPAASGAGTLHLGGTAADVGRAMARVARGGASPRPFVLVTQPSRVDPGRVRDGSTLVWAYAHVPWGTARDAGAAIEREIERAAPGFRDSVLDRHVAGPEALEGVNPSLVGGDFTGGAMTLRGLVSRPRVVDPYRVPNAGARLYLASASAAPGGGFHGMSGWHAAGAALADVHGSP